jgi:hypothetical protein
VRAAAHRDLMRHHVAFRIWRRDLDGVAVRGEQGIVADGGGHDGGSHLAHRRWRAPVPGSGAMTIGPSFQWVMSSASLDSPDEATDLVRVQADLHGSSFCPKQHPVRETRAVWLEFALLRRIPPYGMRYAASLIRCVVSLSRRGSVSD